MTPTPLSPSAESGQPPSILERYGFVPGDDFALRHEAHIPIAAPGDPNAKPLVSMQEVVAGRIAETADTRTAAEVAAQDLVKNAFHAGDSATLRRVASGELPADIAQDPTAAAWAVRAAQEHAAKLPGRHSVEVAVGRQATAPTVRALDITIQPSGVFRISPVTMPKHARED